MGIKLYAGITKKVGLPNYGSAGSLCNVEIELDSSVLERPDEFHRRVREAYVACRTAVEDELQHHRTHQAQEAATNAAPPVQAVASHATQPSPAPTYPAPVHSAPTYPAPQGHGSQGHGSQGHSSHGRGAPSPKQVEYVYQLARQVKLGSGQKLERLCEQMYGKQIASLTGVETSNLIDTLREAKAGRLDLAAL